MPPKAAMGGLIMGSPVTPVVLVVGRSEASRLKVKQVLDQAGVQAIACEATEHAVAQAAAHHEFQLIVSVDVPQRESHTLVQCLPQRSVAVKDIPIFYLDGIRLVGHEDELNLSPEELTA